jgi:HEAT repeat protein
LRDRSSGVRLRAVVGLTVANDARSAGPLLALLETEKDAEISEAARRAIASHLRALKPAPLVALLKERRQSRENRIFAIEVLGELRSREGIEPLVAALKADDESEEVKKGCLQALMRIEGLDLQRLLLALLDRKDAALNRFIAAGIQQLTGQDLGADSQKMRQWVLQNRGRLEDK